MSLIMDAIKRAQQLRLKEQMKTPPLKEYGSLRPKRGVGRKLIWSVIVAGVAFLPLAFLWGLIPSSLSPPQQKQTTLSAAKSYVPGDSKGSTETQEPPKEKAILSAPQPSSRALPSTPDSGKLNRAALAKELKSPREPYPFTPSLKTGGRTDEPVEFPQVENTSPFVKPSIEKQIEDPPSKQRLNKKLTKPQVPSETESEMQVPYAAITEELSQKVSPPLKEKVSSEPIPIAPERGKSSTPVSDAALQFNLGVQFRHQREISKAIQAYRKVIAIDPTYIEAYNNLGIIYQEIGDYNNALWAYQTSIGINPHYEKALNNLGILLYLTERYEESIEAFQKVLAINSNHIEGNINLGTLFKKQGQMDQAMACYQKVLTINPLHGEAHYNIGLLYEQLENVVLAVGHYQKFIQLSQKTHPDLVAKVQRHLNYLIGVRDKGR